MKSDRCAARPGCWLPAFVGRLRPALATLLAGSVVGSSGCVERRMTIRSDPPNALVLLDGQEIGHTPISTSFTYYGERQIKLIKDGFEPKTINQTISVPWYEMFPIDFVSEALVPLRLRDERNYVYTLEPALMVPTDQLLQRADTVRTMGRNPPPDVLKRAGVTATGEPIPTEGGR